MESLDDLLNDFDPSPRKLSHLREKEFQTPGQTPTRQNILNEESRG